jgi:hypothetical protein
VFVESVAYTVIVYPMMSFQWTLAKFLWFFYVSFLTFLYFTYYGMMTVSISPNGQVASIFAAAFYSFFNLFSGFFVARSVSHLIFFLLQKQILRTPTHSGCYPCILNQFMAFFYIRKSQNGGFGTIGFAQWHGRFTDLLCRNTEMWRT